MFEKLPKSPWFYFTIWTVINTFSAFFSELYSDEAYYYTYTLFPAWGYFDHPPMVAWVIKLGFSIFQNELGVRLVAISMTIGSIAIIRDLIVKENEQLFWLLVFASFPMHLFGFMALPDTPFVFFTCVFFWTYRRFLNKPNLLYSIALGLIIAALFMSKYHAILIVLFTILGNIKLLKTPWLYLITISSLAFLAPHIYWQVSNGYPSLQYHLADRSTAPYSLFNTIEYIYGQALYFVPIISLPIIIKLFKVKFNNTFDKTLFINLIGTFTFFFLMTFKGRIELNWTIPGLPAFFILATNYFGNDQKIQKLAKIIVPVNLIVLLAMRVHIATPLFFYHKDKSNEFKGHTEFANKVKEASQGLPIVANTYQDGGLLSFYLRDTIISLNATRRENMFSMIDFGDKYDGKKVAFLYDGGQNNGINSQYHTRRKTNIIDTLNIYRNVDIKLDKAIELTPATKRLSISTDFSFFSKSNNGKPLYLSILASDKDTSQKSTIIIKEDQINQFIEYDVDWSILNSVDKLNLRLHDNELFNWEEKTYHFKND